MIEKDVNDYDDDVLTDDFYWITFFIILLNTFTFIGVVLKLFNFKLFQNVSWYFFLIPVFLPLFLFALIIFFIVIYYSFVENSKKAIERSKQKEKNKL